MGHISQTYTAKSEISVIASRPSAYLASVAESYCEFLRLAHLGNPCISGHIDSLFLLRFLGFLKRHAHKLKKLAALFVAAGGGDETYVHTAGFGRFFHIYLREYVMLFKAEVKIPPAVEALRIETLKVPYSGTDYADESVHKFIHFCAAQSYTHAYRHAFAQFEI